MTNIIVACDDEDPDLGRFFKACLDNLATFFRSDDYTLETVLSKKLNSVYLQIIIEKISTSSFIICPYSHGEADSLLCKSERYVEKDVSMHLFSNSFFYSFSCFTSLELGKSLVENGCRAFIGYNNKASIWTTYQSVFVECANHAMKVFVEGHSLSFAFDKMVEKHNEEVDKIYATDFLIASVIMENRDGLTFLGDGETIIDDFKH